MRELAIKAKRSLRFGSSKGISPLNAFLDGNKTSTEESHPTFNDFCSSLWFSAPYLFGLESQPSSETNPQIVENADSIKDYVK